MGGIGVGEEGVSDGLSGWWRTGGGKGEEVRKMR